MEQQVKEQIEKIYKESECIFEEHHVKDAISRMAAEMRSNLASTHPVFLVVMKGAAVFAGQLLPKLDFPLEVDYVHATRYQGEMEAKELVWRVKPQTELKGRVVVILDDVMDEGCTLMAIQELCHSSGAQRVELAVLIDKSSPKRVSMEKSRYIGLNAPDRFLFGYGMDYKEYWRNAPGIFALPKSS